MTDQSPGDGVKLLSDLKLFRAWYTRGGPMPSEKCPHKVQTLTAAIEEIERLNKLSYESSCREFVEDENGYFLHGDAGIIYLRQQLAASEAARVELERFAQSAIKDLAETRNVTATPKQYAEYLQRKAKEYLQQLTCKHEFGHFGIGGCSSTCNKCGFDRVALQRSAEGGKC